MSANIFYKVEAHNAISNFNGKPKKEWEYPLKLILATPIYSWSCTAPMKALLDRLVYGMNKYYGDEKGPALWKGKSVAMITTCGYPPEKGADLFEESMKRYCKHSQLVYEGMLSERDLGYKSVFKSDDKTERARAFARDLVCRV